MRAVATDACRRAANTESFVARVKRETGLALEIISAGEEASLALAGCAPLLALGPPYALVFDVGGGSSELMWVEARGGNPRLIDFVSLPVGVVGLAEMFGSGADAFEDMVAVASDRPLDVGALEQALARHGTGWGALSGRALDAWVGGAEVLTDDHAPVDQLLTPYAPVT